MPQQQQWTRSQHPAVRNTPRILRCCGVHVQVTASETEEGRAWAEARIKQMTGGDPITARFMHRDNFTFIPQFKLTIVGNHHPVLKTTMMQLGAGSTSFRSPGSLLAPTANSRRSCGLNGPAFFDG